MPVGDIFPEIALVVGAVTIVLFASFAPQRTQGAAALLALVALAAALALVLAQSGPARTTFSGTWALDGASKWARVMILAVTGWTVLMSSLWFATDRRHGEYYALLLFCALGAMGLAGAADLLQLVMVILLSSVTGYTLAAYHRDFGPSVEAGMKYFLIGALVNTLLVTGVVLIYGTLGSTDYDYLSSLFAVRPAQPTSMLGIALVLVALAYKLGAVPAHAWMPDVAQGAPAPVAAFLTIAPKIGGAIALYRFVGLMAADRPQVTALIAVLSALTMTFGNLAALWQSDVRRLLGWSAVSQSGYALMAVAVIGATGGGLAAVLFFLLGYAAANALAFGAVIHLRGRTRLADYTGLAHARPLTAIALIVGLLSLVGIPPLVGFVGKLELFRAVLSGNLGWLAILAVANTVLSLFYYLRVIAPMVLGRANGPIHTLSRTTGAGVVIALALVILSGILSGPILEAFSQGAALPR